MERMQNRVSRLLLLLVFASSPLQAADEREEQKVHPTVFTDSNFDAEVERAGGLVLIEFWADWCGPCRMLAPILEALAAEYAGRVKICKVDVSDETTNPQIARRFDPEPLPCMVLFRKGREVDRRIGAGPNAAAVRSSLSEWFDRNLKAVSSRQ